MGQGPNLVYIFMLSRYHSPKVSPSTCALASIPSGLLSGSLQQFSPLIPNHQLFSLQNHPLSTLTCFIFSIITKHSLESFYHLRQSLCNLYLNVLKKNYYVISSILHLPFSLKLPLVWSFNYHCPTMLFLRTSMISLFLNPKSILIWPSSSIWHSRPCPLPWNTFLPVFQESSFSWFSSYLIDNSSSVALAGFSSHQLCNVKYCSALSSTLLPSSSTLSLGWSNLISWL